MSETIDSIGTILQGDEQRDAIHIAVFPATTQERLWPGVAVDLVSGTSNTARIAADDQGIGIVDPFLDKNVQPGQAFWVFLRPSTITGLRHDWTHPVIDRPAASDETPPFGPSTIPS